MPWQLSLLTLNQKKVNVKENICTVKATLYESTQQPIVSARPNETLNRLQCYKGRPISAIVARQ